MQAPKLQPPKLQPHVYTSKEIEKALESSRSVGVMFIKRYKGATGPAKALYECTDYIKGSCVKLVSS